MQAGQNPADPLTQLNGPRGHGLAGFNPFAGTGVNLNDPNMVRKTSHGIRVISEFDKPCSDAIHARITSIPTTNVRNDVEPTNYGTNYIICSYDVCCYFSVQH
jgi:hypothetical protein